MLTKEEVDSIVSYCKKSGTTISSRLEELGISSTKFYKYKKSYSEQEEALRSGEFVEITNGEGTARSQTVPHTPSGSLNIELEMRSGAVLRVQGAMDMPSLQQVIKALAYVLP